MDLYGHLLSGVWFPAFERLRGRPTIGLLKYLDRTQWAGRDELHAIQSGLLRRLVRHAHAHTAWYRRALDARGVLPTDILAPEDLAALPLLERADARGSLDARTSDVPPRPAIRKQTSGSTGEPLVIAYSEESRHWRDATRWRGYGWAGYRPGHRALHYWGALAAPASRRARWKIQLDHALNRNRYLDCAPRDDAHLARVLDALRAYRPEVIVAHAQAAAELARYVTRIGTRLARRVPVICSAERLFGHDREAIEAGLGRAFEVYGSREFMMVSAECEAHDGMHVAMETVIVELVVRQPDGTTRPAAPGEVGEVVVTDLHNLAAPMIRYVTGDLATRGPDAPCACGRRLDRLGPVEGRTIDTLRDARGGAVGGHVFSIVFLELAEHCRQYQVVQRADLGLTIRVVPAARALPAEARRRIEGVCRRYLPGLPVDLEVVPAIPAGPAGKRRLVIVEADRVPPPPRATPGPIRVVGDGHAGRAPLPRG